MFICPRCGTRAEIQWVNPSDKEKGVASAENIKQHDFHPIVDTRVMPNMAFYEQYFCPNRDCPNDGLPAFSISADCKVQLPADVFMKVIGQLFSQKYELERKVAQLEGTVKMLIKNRRR